MSALKEAKIDENTLVIFLSDNGASDVAVRPELDKPGTSWRLDGLPTHVGNDYQNQPGSPETFMSAGAEWSQVSNAPFRGHKNGNFEGGISTPCLMRWPAVIQKAGTTTDEPSHIVDIMATILEITGITYPDSFQDRSVQSLDGKSLLPTLCGKARTGHEYLAWATSGSRAIRKGRWKLVASPQSSWQLYDMATDRSEQHDLATSDPNRVTEMNQLFVDWLKH